MALKSCSLVWADRMSRTPQRCSGMSNRGSPADHQNLLSVSRMCWSLMAMWMCWFSGRVALLHGTLRCGVPAELIVGIQLPC